MVEAGAVGAKLKRTILAAFARAMARTYSTADQGWRCPRDYLSQPTRPRWSYSSDFHQSPPGRSATSLAINSRRPFVLRPRGPSGAQRVLQEPGVLWKYPSGLDGAAAPAPAVPSPPCAWAYDHAHECFLAAAAGATAAAAAGTACAATAVTTTAAVVATSC